MVSFLAAYMPHAADKRRNDSLFWGVCCALLVLPFGAALHHAVFHTPTCMLNNFDAPDYTSVGGLGRWLRADPSLPWAIVAASATYKLGTRWNFIKRLAIPINLSFLPLSIWIWDIPFTNRIVCHTGHDGRFKFAPDAPMRTAYLYLLGMVLYLAFLLVITVRNREH